MGNNREPVKIISDEPVKIDTDFGFDAYINTISDLIAYKENETPLVIGVYGPWGSGKTTLMESIKEKLETDPDYKPGTDSDFRKCKTVWFQAWKYKGEDEILAALIEQIYKTMEQGSFFEKGKAYIQDMVDKVDMTKLAASLVTKITAKTFNLNEFLKDAEYKKALGFYDVFDEFFSNLIWTYLSWRPQKDRFEEYDETKGVLTIFIDDLDRCPADRIVKVLETIKLFMDKKGCVFVIGAADEIIVKALAETYKEDADNFMDKIVQVTFNLPRIPVEEFKPFLDKCGNDFGKSLEEHLELVIPAMENNPRRIKRFINDFNLMKGLVANKSDVEVRDDDLMLWNIIEKGHREFYSELKNKGGFGSLSKIHEIIDQALEDDIELNMINEKVENVPETLTEYFKDIDLIKIVDKFRPDKEALEQLITLTGIVEAPKKEKQKKTGPLGRKMVLIPKGEFIYQDNENEKIDHDYEIDLFPVTNQLYEKFIQAGGYSKEELWEPAGWKWREKGGITLPDYWDNNDYSDPEQPVVGVSWYEADAYTKWLTSFEQGFEYRLPTEMEWERAARGDKGNIYPWGEEWDPDRCNSEESGIGKTTRVTVYPNGVSPYGCYDMAGNVWEWTLSFYDKDGDTYTLRGGSFSRASAICRCAYRSNCSPNYRHYFIGFRCARIKV